MKRTAKCKRLIENSKELLAIPTDILGADMRIRVELQNKVKMLES